MIGKSKKLPTFRSLMSLLQHSRLQMNNDQRTTSIPSPAETPDIRASEESIFNYITFFTSTLDIYNSILKQFEEDVRKILSGTRPQDVPQDMILTGLDMSNNAVYTTSAQLRQLALAIPEPAYKNIADATLKFGLILRHMEGIKKAEQSRQQVIPELVHSPTSIKTINLSEELQYSSQSGNTTVNPLLLLLLAPSPGSETSEGATLQPNSSTDSILPIITNKSQRDSAVMPNKQSEIKLHKMKFKEGSKHKGRKSRRSNAASCTHCGTSSTPEWRRGPDGCRTLCNACGLFYSKLRKKFAKNAEFGDPAAGDIMAHLKNLDQCLMRNVPEFDEARELLKLYRKGTTIEPTIET